MLSPDTGARSWAFRAGRAVHRFLANGLKQCPDRSHCEVRAYRKVDTVVVDHCKEGGWPSDSQFAGKYADNGLGTEHTAQFILVGRIVVALLHRQRTRPVAIRRGTVAVAAVTSFPAIEARRPLGKEVAERRHGRDEQEGHKIGRRIP
jgi:hypothetical protein